MREDCESCVTPSTFYLERYCGILCSPLGLVYTCHINKETQASIPHSKSVLLDLFVTLQLISRATTALWSSSFGGTLCRDPHIPRARYPIQGGPCIFFNELQWSPFRVRGSVQTPLEEDTSKWCHAEGLGL